jgi:hypothetical protein
MNKNRLTFNLLLITTWLALWVVLPSVVFFGILPLLVFLFHSLMMAFGTVCAVFFSYWSYVLYGVAAAIGFVIIFTFLFSLGRLLFK